MASHRRVLHLLFLAAVAAAIAVAVAGEEEAFCGGDTTVDMATLRADRLTVLLSGYSERRLPLLRAIAAAYAADPLVLAVVVLWSNPTTPSTLLLSTFPPPPATTIALHRTASTSLNSRFLPLPSIRTAAVAVADDDVLPSAAALSLAFATWQHRSSSSGPLIGFFPRSHHLDLTHRRWTYTAATQPEGRYSMVLTKLLVVGVDLLYKYTCSPELAAARAVVDRERNCEDILMNFVAADVSGEGPVLVEAAGGVRDWGDPRNAGGEVVKGVGLSSTGGMAHWEKRGNCITEFHRLLGRMPLRYSYGKVVVAASAAAGGEPGLCSKGGRLVRCDHE